MRPMPNPTAPVHFILFVRVFMVLTAFSFEYPRQPLRLQFLYRLLCNRTSKTLPQRSSEIVHQCLSRSYTSQVWNNRAALLAWCRFQQELAEFHLPSQSCHLPYQPPSDIFHPHVPLGSVL